jgi:hypothetical protein
MRRVLKLSRNENFTMFGFKQLNTQDGGLFTGSATISFSRKTVFHGTSSVSPADDIYLSLRNITKVAFTPL